MSSSALQFSGNAQWCWSATMKQTFGSLSVKSNSLSPWHPWHYQWMSMTDEKERKKHQNVHSTEESCGDNGKSWSLTLESVRLLESGIFIILLYQWLCKENHFLPPKYIFFKIVYSACMEIAEFTSDSKWLAPESGCCDECPSRELHTFMLQNVPWWSCWS